MSSGAYLFPEVEVSASPNSDLWTAGGALLGGPVGALAGSLLGGMFNNNSAAAEGKNQREWSKMMSDTAHQREVEDLKRAGLNPILSANGGASVGSAGIAQTSDIVTPAISTALQGQRVSNESKLMQKELAVKDSQMDMNDAYATAAKADAAAKSASARQSEINNEILSLQLPKYRAQAEFDNTVLGRALIKWDRGVGHSHFGSIFSSAKDAASAFNLFKGKDSPFSGSDVRPVNIKTGEILSK